MQEEKDILIIKFLSNEATAEELAEFHNWIESSEENQRYFADFEEIFNATQIIGHKNKFNALDAYHNFQKENKKTNKSLLTLLLPIAATLVISFGLSFLYFQYFGGSNSGNELTVIESPSGSKSIVNLPDGTTITLNANSRLEYSSSFNKENREVYLEGEGYFDVTKSETNKFIVKTSDIEIKVFGTVFNVKSYPEEKTIETTLVEGSIAIHSAKEEGNKKIVQLLPNQSAVFYRKSGHVTLNNMAKNSQSSDTSRDLDLIQKPIKKIENIILTENVDTDMYTSWKDNILTFNNETFETLAKRLERQYGAEIEFIDKSVKDYRFTGTFHEISIDQALNSLQFASYFNYKIEEDKVFISK
jgi:ferric-dicitrate binding protein FerR (iron transport regulator)